MKNEVFKVLRCKCGKQSYQAKEVTPAPKCPRCDQPMKYSSDWYIKVIVDGKRHIQKVARQQRQAESVLKQAQTELYQEKFFGHKKTEDLSWEDAVDRFDTFNRANCRGKTATFYRDRLSNMGRIFFGRHTLQEINDPELVNRYKLKRLAEVSGTSVNRELACIKRMVEVFTDGSILTPTKKPYLEYNRLKRVKKVEENPSRERFPTVEEMALLIRHAVNDRFRLYLLIMLFSGLRPGNAKSLEWSELNFADKQIIIPAIKSKNRKPIYVDLLDPLAKHLEAWREQGRGGERYVLPGDKEPKTSHYKDERGAFSRTCAAAGIAGLTPHCLRHGVATLLAELNDGNLRLVQETLNQNSLTMARRYTHMRDTVRQQAMEKMGAFIDASIRK